MILMSERHFNVTEMELQFWLRFDDENGKANAVLRDSFVSVAEGH